MQFAWAASLRGDIAHWTWREFESLPGRRQGRGDRYGPQGAEGGNATGQCDPSGNGRASPFSEPRTAHDAGKASRKISRCSGAYAARSEDRDRHPPDGLPSPCHCAPPATLTMRTVGKTQDREMIFGGCTLLPR